MSRPWTPPTIFPSNSVWGEGHSNQQKDFSSFGFSPSPGSPELTDLSRGGKRFGVVATIQGRRLRLFCVDHVADCIATPSTEGRGEGFVAGQILRLIAMG